MLTAAPRFDAFDPAVLADPYPTYARLRAAGRVCRGGPGQWVVTRYADVAALLRDPRLRHEFPPEYRAFSMGEGPASEFFGRIVLTQEPPRHTRLRQLMRQAFRAPGVHALSRFITRTVDGLLEAARDRGTLDAVGDIAFPLPVLVVCELVGIPQIDRDEVRPHAIDLAKGFATRVPESERGAVNAAVVWLREYIRGLARERRARPTGDLLSALMTDGGPDRLTDEEAIDNAIFLFFAGFETTMNLIATGCATLAARPDALAQLRAEPALMPGAVDEILRFDAPIQSATRLLAEPIAIGPQIVKRGRVLVLLLGSANHDERQFVEPERFDLRRTPNPHVSFGGGIHHCLGALLAQLEASIALSRLLDTFASIELGGTPVRRSGVAFRSYQSVPLAVTSI